MEERYKKDLIFLKGFAKGRGYNHLLHCIEIAIVLHEGQTRKSGEPYISHPARVTNALLLLGVDDETTLSAGMLHDVIEDCSVSRVELREKYGVPDEILKLVDLLSKVGCRDTAKYYQDLRMYPGAALVKLADRCHNISTMVGAFSKTKMQDYITETEEYVLPLGKYAVKAFPQYSEAIYTMRYHIESVLAAVKILAREDV